MKRALKTKLHPEDEFIKAGRRIMAQQGLYGGPRPCALAWLLKFAQEDLPSLGFGDWANLWHEVKRFAADGGLGETVVLTSVRLKLPDRVDSPWTETRMDAGPGERDSIQTLKAALLTQLRLYLHDENGAWARGQMTDLHVSRQIVGVAVHGADLQTGFFHHAFHLLGELGNRIRECRGCGRLFLAGRTDKYFCSGLCQAKAYKREHPIKKKGAQHGAKRR